MTDNVNPRLSGPQGHRPVLLLLALLLCAWGIWGTIAQGWWAQTIWPSSAAGVAFRGFIGGALLVSAVCLWAGLPLLLLMLVPVLLFAGIAGIGAVLAVAWYWLCATVIGAWVLTRIKDAPQSPWTVRNSAVGFVVTGTVIGLMAHFPVNTPTIYLALISVSALLCARALGLFKEQPGGAVSWRRLLQRQRRGAAEIALLAMVVFGVVLVLFVTMLPELGHDALSMHLNIPARMLESKRWDFDVTQYIWSVMPFGANWLLVPSYFLGGEAAAKLMDTSFVLATAWQSYRILQPRIGHLMALAAPALLLTLPLTMLVSGSVFVEPVIAFLFLLCLSELTGTSDQRRGTWLVLAALAGYLCSAKLLGAPLLPILLAAVCLLAREGRFERPSFRLVASAVLLFMLVAAQPYVVAWLKTGNPLFPFYNNIFKSPYFTIGSVFNNGQAFANPLYAHPLSVHMFWDASIKSLGYGEFGADGAIGIAFLVLVPLGFAAALLRRNWWVLGGMLATMFYCVLVFQTQAYLRYVFQVLPWFVIFGVWALSRLPRPAFSATVLVFALCLISLMRYPVVYWPLAQFSPRLLIDRDAHRDMLERSKPAVIVGDIIARMPALRGKQILLVGSDPVYSHFPAGMIAFSWHSWQFYSSPERDTNFKKLIKDFGIEVVVHPVGQNESHEADIMSMTDELFTVQGMRVGRVRSSEADYVSERVAGPDLSRLDSAWRLDGNAASAAGVTATVNHPITQLIEVKGRRRGLLEMKVSCPQDHYFRSQVNWLDTRRQVKATDIEVHACHGQDTIIKRLVDIPAGISQGVLYGGSHDEQQVLLQRISFRTAH